MLWAASCSEGVRWSKHSQFRGGSGSCAPIIHHSAWMIAYVRGVYLPNPIHPWMILLEHEHRKFNVFLQSRGTEIYCRSTQTDDLLHEISLHCDAISRLISVNFKHDPLRPDTLLWLHCTRLLCCALLAYYIALWQQRADKLSKQGNAKMNDFINGLSQARSPIFAKNSQFFIVWNLELWNYRMDCGIPCWKYVCTIIDSDQEQIDTKTNVWGMYQQM